MNYQYHSSPSVNRDSIARRGLLTMSPSNSWGSGLDDQPSGVYMLRDIYLAIEWPKSSLVGWSNRHPYMVCDTFDVWRIDMSGVETYVDDPALDFEPWVAEVCTHNIDPQFVDLVEANILWDITDCD